MTTAIPAVLGVGSAAHTAKQGREAARRAERRAKAESEQRQKMEAQAKEEEQRRGQQESLRGAQAADEAARASFSSKRRGKRSLIRTNKLGG